MSSSVFFKFKSSKEPQRIVFDGTGITVFELKKEIIKTSGLGDGTDFDLSIYSEDANEEYDDDTTIIPRSSSVVARRFPAQKAGHGKAARYVSGKMPVNAKNTYRTEAPTSKPAVPGKSVPSVDGASDMNKAQTEEERIAAMFKAGGDQWEQQQAQMANAKPVYRGGHNKKPNNVPAGDPPPGYICYRCHEKGHWIQACPTNDDPNFENKPRVKRSTGIPKSFLKTIAKPVALANDGLTDDGRQPATVLMDRFGNYVVAEADERSWEQFQEKAKASAAKQKEVDTGSKELQDRGLECSIDKRLFVDPMKTPCCGKTYCHDCIENALVNSDLVCPNCSKEGVLIDDLIPDEEMNAKIKAYEDEKIAERKAKEASKSPKGANAATAAVKDETSDARSAGSKSPTQSNAAASTPSTAAATPATNGNPKKRPAEDELNNDRVPTAPAAMRKQQAQTVQAPSGIDQNFVEQMNALSNPLMMQNQQLPGGNFNSFQGQGMNGMGFPNQNGMMGMPMGTIAPMMGMSAGMMNPMMMQGGGSWPNMNGMGGMGFPQQNGYGNYNQNMVPNGGYGYQHWQGQQGWAMNGMNGMPQPQMGNGKMGGFPNQQRTVFSEPVGNQEDDAYFRKPVNPHRHQHRQKRVRPSDYREL
ncbi:Protein mpe1 [Coniosporium tulheliwenetii]|uniref:Protein mpe1 n=1 Tax=Coniosporium tulheliwenetii TaxID=3383036 RepID=A0ACC2ZN46_9PEZI|nr:Protein mpe1 [Cladosporium sp. JES 115]